MPIAWLEQIMPRYGEMISMSSHIRLLQRAILAGIALVLAGCSDDPARSVRIFSLALAPVTTVYTPPRGPERNLIPEFCPPAEDSSGPGAFGAKGACQFQRREPVNCEALADDFIVAVTQKAKNGALLVIYLNVEHYHGPGVYDAAQLFLAVEGGDSIYRWSNDNMRATVGPAEAFVTLPETQLAQEPMHVVCSRLIGPESNYTYQCAASSRVNPGIDGVPEIVSGRLQCGSRAERSPEGGR